MTARGSGSSPFPARWTTSTPPALCGAGAEAVPLWHADDDLQSVDAVVVPGGFSYGDYLRAGAIAAQAPVMRAVIDRARAGLPVLGICNGFQILCRGRPAARRR